MPDSIVALTSLLDSHAAEEVVGGNKPFLLEGAAHVWLVGSGKVEVFLVRAEGGEVRGSREHFLTAGAGDALFGMNLAAYGSGLGLLAVGVMGTRLLRLDVSSLRRALVSDRGGEAVAEMVDRWIVGLSAGVSRTILPKPRAEMTLVAGDEGELGDGERMRAKRGVVWVRHLEGASLFLGMEPAGRGGPDGPFPITTETFLQAMGAARLRSVATKDVLHGTDGWTGLERFYSTVFSCELLNAGLSRADELNRLREKSERDQRLVSGALVGLVSILERGTRRRPSADFDDPLLAAVKIIGDRVGFNIKVPRGRRTDGTTCTDADRVSEIVRASRIRERKVILKSGWWTDETAPLLAFIEDGHRPVAILPRGAGKLELHDPSDGTVVEVGPEIAAGLEPAAHTFYRTFPDGRPSSWRIFRFALRDNGRDVVRPLLFALAAGLLALLPPYFTGVLVQTVIPEASRNRLIELAVILVVVAVTTTLLAVVKNLSVLRLEIKMSGGVQPAMWDRLIGLPLSFFRKHVAGDLMLRVSSIEQIRQVMSGVTMATLISGLFSLLYVGLLLYYSWRLTVVAILLALVLLAATCVATYAKLRIQRALVEIQGKISGLVLQFLAGVSKLRVAAAERRALAEWARKFSVQKTLALRAGTIDAWLAVFVSGFPVLASMSLFYSMVYLSERALETGQMPLPIGDFVGFHAAFGMLMTQMLELGTTGLSILVIIPLWERARPILETRQEVDESKAEVGELNGQIEVSHVSFRYHEDQPLVLDDVSIEIPPGKYVALVGPSGSGKSTLLRLMLGLEEPESGGIYFDGRDLSQLNVQQLRGRIGVVTQNGRIRHGTIYENIVGSQSLTIKDAREAARMAGLEADIREMPMGMYTILQPGGAGLSGGQRQRLMIARAVVTRPRVLFFDEATSALDNIAQAVVSDSLQELQSTRVAIAHRLSTIAGADRIYVLVNGKVAQAGTYQELIAREGVFQQLVKRQIA